MKKKLTGLSAILAAIAAAVIASRGGAHKPEPPVPPPTYTLTVHVFAGDPAADMKISDALVASGELRAVTDAEGNVNLTGLPAGPRHVCAIVTGLLDACADVTMPVGELNISLVPPPPVVTLAALSTRGPIFLQGGTPWRWKGVSAFQLLDRFVHGEDIAPFLDAYQGFNVLRVWLYVPRKDWGDRAWDTPTVGQILPFLWAAEARGFYVELTLLTDDDPARLARAKELVAQLAAEHPTNLLLEAGNEPQTHKAIDTAALIPALQASGFPWTTGDYEDSARMQGTYGVTHTARDGEWPRRAHDVLEFYHGGGPNTPDDPPHHAPIIADEPAKLQDVGGDHALDWRAYFATVSLLGGGGTFHSETGKFGQAPTGEEAQLAREALTGLDAFPPDAPLGPYSRPVESSLRTYIVGSHMVRIRPTRPPPDGWTCDAAGVICHR
jgi:hypothetical protein